MKQTGIVMPGYQTCDYMLILALPTEIGSRVSSVRDEFNKEYKVVSTPNKPNVILATFTQLVMKEERISNHLHTIAMGYPPFKVELKDFGSFPSHTIYVGVTSKIGIQALVKTVRTEMQALMKLDRDNKPYFALEPHVTIARKLKPWQYEKGWLEFSNKHFTGRFIAHEMTLLKRAEGERPWRVVQSFKFENLPVTTKQGELF